MTRTCLLPSLRWIAYSEKHPICFGLGDTEASAIAALYDQINVSDFLGLDRQGETV